MNGRYSNQKNKPLYWVASSKKDLRTFPDDVIDVVGYALRIVQQGGMPDNATPMKGYKGIDVCEIIEQYDTDTYRAIYTAMFANAVYVLHVFKKKSKTGIKTPKKELDIIRQRLQCAEEDYTKKYPKESC